MRHAMCGMLAKAALPYNVQAKLKYSRKGLETELTHWKARCVKVNGMLQLKAVALQMPVGDVCLLTSVPSHAAPGIFINSLCIPSIPTVAHAGAMSV